MRPVSRERTGTGVASSCKTSALLEAPAPGVQRWQEDLFIFFVLLVSLALVVAETCENMTTGAHKLLSNQSQKYQISPEVLRFVTVNQNQDFGDNFFFKTLEPTTLKATPESSS